MNFLGFKNFGIYDKVEHENILQKSPTLYHYTTIDAFEKIVKLKSLWATNCQHLHDTTETSHIVPILESIAKEKKE